MGEPQGLSLPDPISAGDSQLNSGQNDLHLPASIHLLVLAGFALLTFVLTLPLGLRLFTHVVGGGDAWQHIWNLWWVKEALVNLQTNPYHTDLLYYPQGVDLYFHTLVLSAGLIGIPLQLAGFNLIATYNIVLLLTFVLAGYGMFLLCYYLTRHKWASFVGGLVFTFAPYHFAHMFGHMNLVSLQWIPFYVIALLKAVDLPGEFRRTDRTKPGALWWAAGAGALLALNAYTDWVYAIFLALLTGLVIAWKLFMPSERQAFQERGIGWGHGVARLAVGAGAFLLLSAPIFFPTLAEASKGYAQQPPLETLVYSSDAVLAFTPSELHPIWGPQIRSFVNSTGPYLPMKNPSERVVFLGFSVLLLAGWAAWKLRADRNVRLWLFIAVVSWVLSLGPIFQLLGKTKFTAFEVTLPLPYLLLYKLPLFSIMRTPARLTVLTMLALGVLAAFSVAALLRATRSPASRIFDRRNLGYLAVAIGLPILILFEFQVAPFPEGDLVPPGWTVPIYAQIAKEPGDFALLELPLRPFGDYMAYQTVHGRPIIGGYLSRQPPYALPEQEPEIKYLLSATRADDPLKESVGSGQGLAALEKLGVKYVIIRWWAFTVPERQEMEAKLNLLLGGRAPDYSYAGDQVDVWQLSPAR